MKNITRSSLVRLSGVLFSTAASFQTVFGADDGPKPTVIGGADRSSFPISVDPASAVASTADKTGIAPRGGGHLYAKTGRTAFPLVRSGAM